MHRAAVRTLRTTPPNSLVRRWLHHSTRHQRPLPFFSHKPPRPFPAAGADDSLKSSMYFRRLPVAVVSSLVVGYGAWYYGSGLTSVPGAARSYNVPPGTPTDAAALPTRTVLVVGADELRQGTIVGEGPISKSTSDDGRKIVEMLTPEQATQKLRRLEQSFSVSRGEGVTRYDLVQLPSNDPIEDDHAEKIVHVPSRSAAAGKDECDWMFWGVFDGHS